VLVGGDRDEVKGSEVAVGKMESRGERRWWARTHNRDREWKKKDFTFASSSRPSPSFFDTMQGDTLSSPENE
jgi:hypothetical protein